MVDFLFTLGQAASVMLLIYGALLAWMPERKSATDMKRDEMQVMHLRSHA
jgi:hypothetical protein